jgi:hypothetical protein
MNVSPPKPTGNNINKFRDQCRKWVNESTLFPAQKLVLCKLADYVNSESLVAWPSFDRLAADTGVSRRTVVNAINAARKLGVVKRIYRGGKLNGKGRSNSYLFPIYEHSATVAQCHGDNGDIVQSTTEHSATDDRTPCNRCTLSSNDLLKDNLRGSPPSSSGLDGHSSVVAQERGSGEEEENPLVWTTPLSPRLNIRPSCGGSTSGQPTRLMSPARFRSGIGAAANKPRRNSVPRWPPGGWTWSKAVGAARPGDRTEIRSYQIDDEINTQQAPGLVHSSPLQGPGMG